MAVPVYVGKTRIDVHTNIRKVTEPDPVTGEIPEDLYVYDEMQMTYQEYLDYLSKETAATLAEQSATIDDLIVSMLGG